MRIENKASIYQLLCQDVFGPRTSGNPTNLFVRQRNPRSSQLEELTSKRSRFLDGLFRQSLVDEYEERNELVDSSSEYPSGQVDEEDLDDFRDGKNINSTRSVLLDSESEDFGDDDEEEEKAKRDEYFYMKANPRSFMSRGTSEPILRVQSSTESESDEDTDDSGDINIEEERYRTNPLQRWQNRFQRSLSMNSYYTDDSAVGGSKYRKRIEEFGSSLMAKADGQPKSLRQQFQDLSDQYQMRRMPVGSEDSIQRRTLLERLDDVVDRVLPPAPELDGYMDAFQVQSASKASTISDGSYAPEEIDEKTYIKFLEGELRKKELELDSWKNRAKELELTIKRINEVEDSDSSDSGSLQNGPRDESEFEWQSELSQGGARVEFESDESAAQQNSEGLTEKTLPTGSKEAFADEVLPTPLLQIGSEKVDSKQVSLYFATERPDAPSDDDDHILGPKEKESKCGVDQADYDFPVLSSSNSNLETTWISTEEEEESEDFSSHETDSVDDSTDTAPDVPVGDLLGIDENGKTGGLGDTAGFFL